MPAFSPKSLSFLKCIYVPNSQQLSSRKGLSAFLAQLGERTTEDRKVPCSIHVGGITFCSFLSFNLFSFRLSVSLCSCPIRSVPFVVTLATQSDSSDRLASDPPVPSRPNASSRLAHWHCQRTRHATADADADGSAARLPQPARDSSAATRRLIIERFGRPRHRHAMLRSPTQSQSPKAGDGAKDATAVAMRNVSDSQAKGAGCSANAPPMTFKVMAPLVNWDRCMCSSVLLKSGAALSQPRERQQPLEEARGW